MNILKELNSEFEEFIIYYIKILIYITLDYHSDYGRPRLCHQWTSHTSHEWNLIPQVVAN